MSLTSVPTDLSAEGLVDAPAITLELELDEAEALRAWLLKPAGDGTASLDEPLVGPVLARLGRAVDSVRAVLAIRHELSAAGLDVSGLDGGQLLELGRRLSQAAGAL